ncbi:hypothetical protein [Halorussus pelagicus]|uniref:hypothetical protein n=1 Tax=Halorussus pelagicus TaxID=2505977 RepID=UPI000FFBFEC7|nr:hypothetical protein [Halorussus pelagicus]
MVSPFENPVVRYGIAFVQTLLLVVIAFAFLDGTMRWLVLGIAILDLLIVPRILKMSAEQSAD